MVQDVARVGVDPWVLVNHSSEPDLYMEIPLTGHGGFTVRAHPSCSVPRHEP